MTGYDDDTAVLIAGGGLAGLSTAVFLSWHNVPVIVVERRGSALIHPRARTVNPRSVELFRQVGLETTVLDARSFTDHSGSVLFRAETLCGPERFRSPLDPPESIDDVSPCPWAPIDQDKLEAILLDYARKLGADVRFGTDLVGFAADEDSVTAGIRERESGTTRQIRARYLVAADGNRSGIRQRLGIGTQGHGTIGHTMTLVFEADLEGPLRGRRLDVCHLDKPASGTVVLSHDGDRRWVFSTPYHPDRGERLMDFDDARCGEMIRAAVGDPAIAVRIVPQLADGTKVLGYELAARVADRFQQGRVFLVGDAAHVVPPTGAFGASTGIADAHNLAWKLAAVLRGDAGPGLLASYDAERRAVADLTMQQALLQLWKRTDPGAASTAVFSPLDYYATVFGYRYRSGAIVDPPVDLPDALPPRELTGQPGTRAPHVPLRHGNREMSTLDLFGRTFVLLAGPEGKAWIEAVRAISETRPTIAGYRIGADLIDPDDVWAERYGVAPDGAVLIRPDGFVAWREPLLADSPGYALTAVIGRLLDRHDRMPATTG